MFAICTDDQKELMCTRVYKQRKRDALNHEVQWEIKTETFKFTSEILEEYESRANNELRVGSFDESRISWQKLLKGWTFQGLKQSNKQCVQTHNFHLELF